MASILEHEQDIISLTAAFRAHSGAAVGHARNGQAKGVGTLLKQFADIGGWDMSFHEIALDRPGVTRRQVDGNAEVDLVLHEKRAETLLTRDLKAGILKVLCPLPTAFAPPALHDMDGGGNNR
ncbi:hypothetical protein IE00_18190 [Paracoccus sp. SM22M-07]|nr:hypothetical protein IE00_18190 [Paracoccus sp. SM22M-07]